MPGTENILGESGKPSSASAMYRVRFFSGELNESGKVHANCPSAFSACGICVRTASECKYAREAGLSTLFDLRWSIITSTEIPFLLLNSLSAMSNVLVSGWSVGTKKRSEKFSLSLGTTEIPASE